MKFVLITCILALNGLFGKNLYSEPIPPDKDNIFINDDKIREYEIDNSRAFYFTVNNESYYYCFSSDTNEVFSVLTEPKDELYANLPNNTFIDFGNIYFNKSGKIHGKVKVIITPYKIQKELNGLETTKEDQYFIIRPGDSIVYFDSFDRNSYFYISDKLNKTILPSDERIDGKFHILKSTHTYIIKNKIYSNDAFSSIKKYIYPLDLKDKEPIVIDGYEINFLYFNKINNVYKLKIQNDTIKKMIRLSSATPDAEVTIKKSSNSVQLNSKNPYYEIGNYTGELEIETKENEALIEFLYNFGDFDILTDQAVKSHVTKKKTVIIKIEKTIKLFGLYLNSDNEIKFSHSLGLSNSTNYSYYSNSNNLKDTKSKSIYLEFYPFKYIEPLDGEFVSLLINFDGNQTINISYNQYSEITELLDEEMDSSKCEEIISNLASIFDYYVYSDIAQNPPNINGKSDYHHKKINLKDEIRKVSTKSRKFYEFYQEIKKILTSTKDLHLNIVVNNTLSGTDFNSYRAVLPFSFTIRQDTDNQTKIFITKNQYTNEFDEETKKFIDSNLNNPLKTVNGIDVFDYIQNWSQYLSCKNPHSQFTIIIHNIPDFYLTDFPINYLDFLNDYEFEDNQILKTKYLIKKPDHLLKTNENYKNSLNSPISPDISEIEENNLKTKELRMNQEKIDWNIRVDNEIEALSFRCRVDEQKGVNVIYQNSFNFNYEKLGEAILECSELFHKNKYPIIIIESLNQGGNGKLALLMHQVLSMRTTNRCYNSFRISELSKEFLQKNINSEDVSGTNLKSCKTINSFEDMGEEKDYYDYNGLNIEHTRTQVSDYLTIPVRKAFEQYRKDNEKLENLKNPTDIIIFTDAFSYSATSVLIKSFQKTGSGIIVGYYGNPKKNGTVEFDASQAYSTGVGLENTQVKENLEKLGYIIKSVTIGETFDESYNNKNPIPNEYQLDEVDERVDIYSVYTDSLYNRFVDEGLKIHKKYQQECNPKNTKLFKYDDKCPDLSDKHAYGAHICNNERKWDDVCKPSYCEIGYYFDNINNECKKECDFEIENAHSHLIFGKDYSKEFKIQQSETNYYILFPNENKYYIFEASDDSIDYYPRISIFDSYKEIIVNKEKKSEVGLKIYSVEKQNNIFYTTMGGSVDYNTLYVMVHNLMIICKPPEDHIMYIKSMSSTGSKQFKFGKLEKTTIFDDIKDLNSKFYENSSDQLVILKQNESYALRFDYDMNRFEPLYIFIRPTDTSKNIEIKGNDTNYLYLKNDTTYTLAIKDTISKRVLKLSRHTNSSKVFIEGRNVELNSTNLYYKIEDNTNGDLTLKVSNSDAFIEILYTIPDIKKLDFKETKYTLPKGAYLLSIPKDIKDESLKFYLKGENTYQYSIFTGYSNPNYVYYIDDSLRSDIHMDYTFEIANPYNANIKLTEDEYYNLVVIVVDGQIKFGRGDDDEDKTTETGEITQSGNGSGEGEKDDGLAGWQIALIVAGVIILLVVIVIVIIIVKKKMGASKPDIVGDVGQLNELLDN